MKKQEELWTNNYIKYKNHITQLQDLDERLEYMRIVKPDSNTKMWVYLQSFKNDNILVGEYIYNFGLMDEVMERHIGEVIDYDTYQQTIVEMTFSDFKELYSMQTKERELLSLEHPGLIVLRGER